MSKSAKKQRRNREKLKEKGQYQDYLKKRAESAKRNRSMRTPEQIKRDQEMRNIQVQRCRQKKKEDPPKEGTREKGQVPSQLIIPEADSSQC